MKKISVIIPMYNAQNTIDECLSSLTSQTIFNDLELVLVDDHSADDTVNHALSFERNFPDNINIVILPDNSGPGHARNIGMEYASGLYIGFVDADDAVVPAMYERLYNEAVSTGADVIDGGLYNKARDEAIVYTADNLKGLMDDKKRSELIVSGGYIWSKLYKRDFLLTEGIKFRDEYVLEDMDFLMEVFCKARIMANVKDILYIYRDSTGSLSKVSDIDRYLHSTISAMNAIYHKLSCLPFYEGIREAVEYSLLQLYSFSVNINLKAAKDRVRCKDEVLKSLEELRNIRFEVVQGGFDNKYVQNKIDKADISIMKKNDESPLELLKEFHI